MENPLKKYNKSFSEHSFWKKLRQYARQAGLKVAYSGLLLYYAFKRKDTPGWAKKLIIGVLGYFISPIDALPDLTPLIGYTDDIGVLTFGLVTVACYINDEVRHNARMQLNNWFDEYDEAELIEIDEKL